MTGTLNKIFKQLGIAEHEKPRVKFLWQLRFLFQVGLIFSWTIITAIFVELFEVQNLLYLLLIDAVLFLCGSLITNFLFLKIKPNNFLLSTILGTVFFALLAWIFRDNVKIFFASAIIAKDLFFSQLNIAILRKNESVFSPKEAQRIMPILESGITIGTVVAAIVFLGLLKMYPTKELLIVWLIPLFYMFYLIWKSPRLLDEIPALHLEEESTGSILKEGVLATQKIHFIALLTAVIFFQSSLFVVADFEFLKSVESHTLHEEQHFDARSLQSNLFQDASHKMRETGHEMAKAIEQTVSKVFVHKTLAHDLGVLSLIFGVIALVVQLFAASRILEKIGIVNSMILYFGGFLGMAFTFFMGGTNMNFVRGFHHGAHSLFESAYHLTFYSIFSHKRETIRYFLEGFIKPLGIIFGISSFFLLQHFLSAQVSGILMIFFSFVLILLFLPMRKKFTLLSKENLDSDQNISAKLHAVEVLGQRGHIGSAWILEQELLKKENHSVIREKIMVTLSKMNEPQIVHTYLKVLADEQEPEEVKIQVLESLFRLKSLQKYWQEHAFSQDHLLRLLQKLFEETAHAHLKKLVIMNIFSHLPAHKVVPFFLKTIEEPDEYLKSVCLRSSAEVFNDPEITYYLKNFLEETNPRLKGHAVISLWKFEEKNDLRSIVDDLLSGDEEEKIAGIYAIGETEDRDSAYKIRPYLNSENLDLKLHALISLAKLNNEEVVPEILEILFGEDQSLSQKVFCMLKRAPKEIRNKLKQEIQTGVSEKVLKLLLSQEIKKREHLRNLSADSKKYLKRLYRLAGKYDDILILETHK